MHLPGTSPADTYLRTDLILDAARRAGADAIHPGYGFLSENADFARAVIDAGLTWIGPPPEAIDSMGSKIESKKLMEAAGVPVLDEPHRRDRHRGRPARCWSRPARAAAGAACASCATLADLARRDREGARPRPRRRSATARSSSRPTSSAAATSRCRSSATTHGNVSVLGERDCSVQRRHQKVVEEAPAPAAAAGDPRRRCTTRRRLPPQAIDYLGAGTVEFLDDADADAFFFLEMNTRLQVEHPVTEVVTASTWSRSSSRSPSTRSRRRSSTTRPTATPSRCASTPRTRPPTTSRRAVR